MKESLDSLLRSKYGDYGMEHTVHMEYACNRSQDLGNAMPMALMQTDHDSNVTPMPLTLLLARIRPDDVGQHG